LNRTAVVLARAMLQDDVEKCYSASVDLINNLPDYEQVDHVLPVAIELGQRLNSQAAKRASDQMWNEIVRVSNPYPIDEIPGTSFDAGPGPEGYRKPTTRQMLNYWIDILASSMTHLPDSDAAATLRVITPTIANWPIVPCRLLAPLTRASTVTAVLPTLGEPTCDPRGRYETIAALGRLKGGAVDNPWDVLRWVERDLR
jgi:hypothetical protein